MSLYYLLPISFCTLDCAFVRIWIGIGLPSALSRRPAIGWPEQVVIWVAASDDYPDGSDMD